jgi:hypothetical protein
MAREIVEIDPRVSFARQPTVDTRKKRRYFWKHIQTELFSS